MLQKLLNTVKKNFPLEQIDSSEFDGLKVSGMKFDINAYEAKGLGHVSTMSAKGFFGLMKMDTLIIVPKEIDLPLFSYDRIKAMGNDTILLEFYDTLLGDCDLESIRKIKAEYSSYPKYEIEARWYDSIQLPETIALKGKKKDAAAFDKLCLDYTKAFLETKAEPVADMDAKLAKSAVYVDGLLSNGGASTDVFLKALGKEKTTRLFKNVLFGA